ncbi:sulfite exporter TauE/SafE family protein [Brucella rhizosphaerae]|uniref:Probable membrane transporter protein n=1 Tax=Brucella rhizosphaerae TaxID=571254 RepID=A0A256FPY2_9HYPH|nr:sulfite exporter TauE/SafE family protein [Brucella rhizosphaerae]OYR16820.1 sulfite exporter TauE/SafE family protein [Brucella rhizosphaerae]
MTFELTVSLLVGAAAGGFINGLAGFGTALLSLGIWLQVLPPWQAVAIAAAMSVISGGQGLWAIRENLWPARKRLVRFLLPAVIAIPLGVSALRYIDAGTLKITIAAFMLFYGAFFVIRRSLPEITRSTPVTDITVGFFSGVLGGAASLSGALPTMWCAMRPWSKSETRAVLQPFNFLVLLITALVYAFQGYYSSQTLIFIAVAFPATLISSQIGIAVFRRLTDHQFRWMLIWLLFLSGALLMLRELA